MTEVHNHLELILLIGAGTACSALLLARLVLLAYDDLRQTWRRIRDSGARQREE